MRTAKLIRQKAGTFNDVDGQIGDFLSDRNLQLKMAELPDRGNAHDISCIPLGDVLFSWGWSQEHFRNCYIAQNVPGGRTMIEIHSYNLAGDRAQGRACQAKGCLGPGMGEGTFPKGTMFHCMKKDGVFKMQSLDFDQRGVTDSVTAVGKLEKEYLENGVQVPFMLTITESA